VDELHDASEGILSAVVPVSAESRREEVQQRTEPFAACAENIFADLLDKFNVGAQAFMDPVLHPFHVGLEFSEDVLEGGYYHDIPSLAIEIIGETSGIVKIFLAGAQ
jgi:hypothetical protein